MLPTENLAHCMVEEAAKELAWQTFLKARPGWEYAKFDIHWSMAATRQDKDAFRAQARTSLISGLSILVTHIDAGRESGRNLAAISMATTPLERAVAAKSDDWLRMIHDYIAAGSR